MERATNRSQPTWTLWNLSLAAADYVQKCNKVIYVDRTTKGDFQYTADLFANRFAELMG